MRFRIAVNRIEKAREQISKMAATPMDYKSEIGQPIIINIVLDISKSMEYFYDEIAECFNDIAIPSFREADRYHRNSLRIGCLLFSKNVSSAWRGFKTLKELGTNPFERSTFEKKGTYNTALYRAMRSGILWTATAMEQMFENGRGEFPKGKVIVFTDGVNNESPKKEIFVKSALDSINKTYLRNLQLSIVFLETDNNLTNEQFGKMCENTGFTIIKTIDMTEKRSIEERKSSFRQQFRDLF